MVEYKIEKANGRNFVGDTSRPYVVFISTPGYINRVLGRYSDMDKAKRRLNSLKRNTK